MIIYRLMKLHLLPLTTNRIIDKEPLYHGCVNEILYRIWNEWSKRIINLWS